MMQFLGVPLKKYNDELNDNRIKNSEKAQTVCTRAVIAKFQIQNRAKNSLELSQKKETQLHKQWNTTITTSFQPSQHHNLYNRWNKTSNCIRRATTWGNFDANSLWLSHNLQKEIDQNAKYQTKKGKEMANANNTMSHRSYFVTGANNGCGFEATRMLALRLSEANDNDNNEDNVTIYLLCRSEEKANAAIQEIRKSLVENNRVHLKFMKFDAYDDEATIRKNISHAIQGEENPPTIAGILLNAGGFGELQPADNNKNTEESVPGACGIAKLNLIGHIFLVRNILNLCKTDSSTRIVPVASEAAFATPGMDYETADFVAHLSGTVAKKDKMMGADYGWTKGILALYWAAYAKHHPEHVVATVSPGAVPSTKLMNQGAVSPALRTIAKITQWQCFGGSHTVQDGAERYVMALLGTGPFGDGFTSGEFWASTRGFAKDFGKVAELKKGKFVADVKLQDKAWTAVQTFV